MSKIEFEYLFDLHKLFQMGTYLNNEIVVGDLTFYRSNVITDADWNFFKLNKSVDDLSSTIDHLKQISSALNRQPILSTLKNSEVYDQIKSQPNSQFEDEYWMTANLNNLVDSDKPDVVSDVKLIIDQVPSSDFLEVFSKLFEDQSINDHFTQFYIPALKKSSVSEAVEFKHVVAYDNKKPVACASVYKKGDFIGLYNVGTIHESQGQGIGKWISSFACNLFGKNERTVIFLQCVTDGHVPKLYQQIGFKIYKVNTLINLAS